MRSDLGLSKITDKNDLLDERVIKHYGNLVPLTPIDSFLLENNQKDTTTDENSIQSNGTNPSTQSQSEQNPSDSTMDQQNQMSNQVNSNNSDNSNDFNNQNEINQLY